MSQSLSMVILHIVFSTKGRQKFLGDEIRSRLHGYLAALCADLGSSCFRVGGISDHVHLATTLPRVLTQARLLEEMKKKSSGWMHRMGFDRFAWQAGYGTFSVSRNRLGSLIDYIDNQATHHQTIRFQDEYRWLLDSQGVAFDERWVWD